ncbi:MAG TPA: hypothetical protein VG939_09960 [Caulobacteraceae bacterium]|nr:hypothetical protein [Caulobacteraceae bacterium]
MTSVLNDPELEALLARLQADSQAQEPGMRAYLGRRAAAGELSWKGLDADAHRFLADKMVALEADKAAFCHLACRAPFAPAGSSRSAPRTASRPCGWPRRCGRTAAAW